METKICLQCQKEFTPKRTDAKFCSSTCKAKHWERNKVKPEENNSVINSLRGILNETSPDVSAFNPTGIQIEADEYKKHIERINELKTSEKRLEEELKRLKEWPLTKRPNKNKPVTLLDCEMGLQLAIEKADGYLTSVRRQIAGLSIKIFGVKQFKTQIVLIEPSITPVTVKSKIADQKFLPNPNISQKIISSQDLKSMNYQALSFQGKWLEFFGYPSVNFHCVIHGMSGEGKSTFAVQFANYLAENFGTVLYISGEEGFSKTFKDKFINNNAFAEGLSVADLRSYDSITKEVQTNTFNFIFIDSLDNLKIDANKMKELRERYRDSALITISQSTKDGKMRGSYEIVHDSDIAVRVENGVAKTTKNRFKQKGINVDVF